jgi:predicted PurR-regulated permease PerM
MKLATTGRPSIEHGFLLLLVIAATLAFGWLIGPFTGAILWGVIAVILFAPRNDRLVRAMPQEHRSPSGSTVATSGAIAASFS